MAEAATARTSGTAVAYLKLFRFPLVFTAIADSLAGHYGVWGWSFGWKIPALLALTSAGLYCFGMAMNDVADHERDKTLAPGRPLPSGKISLRGALIASVLVLGLSLVGLVLNPGTSRGSYGAWAAAVVGILLYDFILKLPPMMGAIRACNFLIGALSGHLMDGLPGIYWHGYVWPAAGLLLYGTSLTFVSKQEDGAVRRGPLWLGAFGMIAGAVLPWASAFPDQYHGLGPLGVLVLWILYRAMHAGDKKGVMLMVRDGVAGFILVDASIVMRFQDPMLGLWIAALLIPAFGLIAVFKRLA